MAKEHEKKEAKSNYPAQAQPAQGPIPGEAGLGPLPPGMPPLPPEVEEKLKVIKTKIDKFQKQLLEKFDKYIVGLGLLPPPRDVKPEQKDEVHLLILVDDSDSTKMSKQELHEKLEQVVNAMAKEIDKNLIPNVVVLSDLWQSCYDGKYDLTQMVALAAPIFDRGMFGAIKIAEIHKEMVLKKFEKYIVTYVLAGSLVQGKATPESDIDVFVVIDDTDVKKMTRGELKDKLRGIIIGMGFEAGQMTGITNKINIQVYILTDFWDMMREANPIAFTFLRDGIPFYDRGIFMPWKQLLKMGKIKPSTEAIDIYMSGGEQGLDRVKLRLKEVGMEDFFWATLTPSQAAIMLYGLPPPTPKETPVVMREVFVTKEKLLTDADIKILENIIRVRKELEHGTKKDITGKEIDELLEDADKYLKRIKRLFGQIEALVEKDQIIHLYDNVLAAVRDAVMLAGERHLAEDQLLDCFEKHLVKRGKLPHTLLKPLQTVIEAKAAYDKGTISKTQVEEMRKAASDLLRAVMDYVQRTRGRELERAKVRVKYGNKFGEVILLEGQVFIVHDLDEEPKRISKAKLMADGNMGMLEDVGLEQYEKALATAIIPPRVFVNEKLFERLHDIFGKNIEVMVSNV
jgi:predicted nucleotidyltransferase/DNA-binding FrmR family transcriptional regulator